jgi:hypothetical protein
MGSVKSSRNRPLKASHDIKLINQMSDDVIRSCSNVGDTNISTGEKTRINSGLNSHVKGRVGSGGFVGDSSSLVTTGTGGLSRFLILIFGAVIGPSFLKCQYLYDKLVNF